MEAFAMFCGIGIHNTKTYESTCKLMAKQVKYFLANEKYFSRLMTFVCRELPWTACPTTPPPRTTTRRGWRGSPSPWPGTSTSTATSSMTPSTKTAKLSRLSLECSSTLISSINSPSHTRFDQPVSLTNSVILNSFRLYVDGLSV